MVGIRTLSRRFSLLREQERDLFDFWNRVSPPDGQAGLWDLLREHSNTEAEYIGAWVNMLIDLLQAMTSDPEHQARLETARRDFFTVMAQIEEFGSKPRAVHWLNILAWALAGALLDDALEVSDIPEGRWSEPLKSLIERRMKGERP